MHNLGVNVFKGGFCVTDLEPRSVYQSLHEEPCWGTNHSAQDSSEYRRGIGVHAHTSRLRIGPQSCCWLAGPKGKGPKKMKRLRKAVPSHATTTRWSTHIFFRQPVRAILKHNRSLTSLPAETDNNQFAHRTM
jgi:hypothetical protein